MQYINLGSSGLQVSRICLGGNSWGAKGKRDWAPFGNEESRPFFKRALERGINFFDTAPAYSDGASEEVLGMELVGSVPRDDLVLLSKIGYPAPGPNKSGLGRKHVMSSIDATLKRLRTDYLDLLVVHRFDPLTPIEEIMSGLADIVRTGKARYLGASTMAARQFITLQLFARANGLPPFIAMQNLHNLLYREDERELIPFCREQGVGLIPYSPLARGILSGTRDKTGGGLTERARLDASRANIFYADHTPGILERLNSIATARGVKPSQVALAWLVHQPGLVAPIVGATALQHIDEAVDSLAINLSADEIKGLEELYKPRTVLN